MNIILPVIHYAQNLCDKVIEPAIVRLIASSEVSARNKAILSFNKDLENLISSCDDRDFIDEYFYVQKNILINKDLAKIYYDYLYSLIKSFCKTNNIILNLKEDHCTFELSW